MFSKHKFTANINQCKINFVIGKGSFRNSVVENHGIYE